MAQADAEVGARVEGATPANAEVGQAAPEDMVVEDATEDGTEADHH